MLKVVCRECRFWAVGVRFRKALELCSQKGVFMGGGDSCEEVKHLDPHVQVVIDGMENRKL